MVNTSLKIGKIYCLIVGVILLSGCRKDDDQIPNVLVDIQININNPGYIQLQAVGGWMYFSGGSRGIVVYRTSPTEFMAYDRHCPYNPSDPCGIVEVDSSSSVILQDPCCGSRYLMTDGSVQTGPSTRPLLRYQTYFDGASSLRIYN